MEREREGGNKILVTSVKENRKESKGSTWKIRLIMLTKKLRDGNVNNQRISVSCLISDS